MARVKPKRHGIHIDMTPMSDLAWLLLTFFILTTQFKPKETVTIDPPSSISQIKVKDHGMMKISITSDGKYYFSMDEEKYKIQLLEAMGKKYGINFTDHEKREFRNLTDFGVSITGLKQYLNIPEGRRESVNVPGIPADSAKPEITDWVFEARELAKKNGDSLDLGIKGDVNTQYPVFKNLLARLQEKNMNKFQLITSAENKPE
ncbi:biopolymer transporter ExbD [Apibacter sp.]|uniref:ExbD/TolR family protein n=1 Tax=Apibacter sp. TaxID=2023709 RepID=UPI0025E5DD2A|nr:biopolymer transporter ExbD [Apibacter sp.]MCT6869297.1 biopolymer transporter ExbD [Apibacter sp.]